MKAGIERFNRLSVEEAESELMKCCGSKHWARRMARERPFDDLDEMLLTADSIWWSLDAADWLEAFSHHPKIGEKRAAQSQSEQARRWSEAEQSGTRTASQETIAKLIEANRAYERKFGYIFIVCASGKSTDEMLALLNERIQNASAMELRIAAEEQRRITHLRLKKLLEQ